MSKYLKIKELESLIEPHLFNDLTQDKYKLEKVVSSELLKWSRLDIAIKLFFLDNKDKGEFAKIIYEKHIQAFTLGSFNEYGNTNKDSIQKYIDSFEITFNTIKNNGFENQISLLPISGDKSILNGAHRLASAIYLNEEVDCVFLDLENQVYDYKFFKQRHLSHDILEIAVSKFIDYSENTYIAFIWPTAQGCDEDIEKIIPNIIYRKEVKLNRNGAHNLLSQIYYGEDWLGNADNDFNGSNGKLVECFKTFDPIRVIAFQEENLDKVLAIKDRVRDVFKVGKHSIHITDTKEEAIRTARIIFNDNSIHFLNYAKPNKYKSTHTKITRFKEFIHEHKIDNDKIIIDSSLILSAYGLREAIDIDYLMDGMCEINNEDPLINSHDESLECYNKSSNELIYNPNNHFYFNDIKFVSFSLLYSMKKRRGEIKDKNDLQMMDALIEEDRVKLIISKLNQNLFYFKVKNKLRFMKTARRLWSPCPAHRWRSPCTAAARPSCVIQSPPRGACPRCPARRPAG